LGVAAHCQAAVDMDAIYYIKVILRACMLSDPHTRSFEIKDFQSYLNLSEYIICQIFALAHICKVSDFQRNYRVQNSPIHVVIVVGTKA
jgi:hypothetical protein